MNRYTFISAKPKFGPELVLWFIKEHPRLSSTQITHRINISFGLDVGIGEVHSVIGVLRKQKKVKITESSVKTGPRGGMVYEAN